MPKTMRYISGSTTMLTVSMTRRERGYTLIEVLVASLIASFVAGGTMMAFTTAARINRQQGSPVVAEATQLAQQTLEKFRNQVAADSTFLQTADVGGWITDDPQANPSTESIVNAPNNTKRCYKVTAEDCDGDGATGDCYAMQAKVCWNFTICDCP